MKMLTNMDFNKNQILNVVIQKLAVSPESPEKGQMYFNTAVDRLFCYNGSEWVGADSIGATMTGDNIIVALNSSSLKINDSNLSQLVNDAISYAHNTHAIADISGLQTALNGKVNNDSVLTPVPTGAKFTDTVTTVNGKTGAISKADIVALGIPSQDTDTTYVTATVTADGLMSNTDKVKLNGVEAGAQVNTVNSVAGKTGEVTLAKTDVGLDKVDNTSDIAKPISTAAQTALNGKVDNARVLTDVPANAKFTDTSYSLPVATATELGGIKSGTDITVDGSGNVSVVNDSHNHSIANVTGLQSALDAKETPAGAQNKATTAEGNAKTYTDTAINDLIGSAPGTLDTLHEIADALGSDPNFATTITNMIGAKPDKYSQAIGNGTLTSIVVTHNLGTRDVALTIRGTDSPYEQVITDVEFTTENTVTLKFAVAPLASQYTVTIIG